MTTSKFFVSTLIAAAAMTATAYAGTAPTLDDADSKVLSFSGTANEMVPGSDYNSSDYTLTFNVTSGYFGSGQGSNETFYQNIVINELTSVNGWGEQITTFTGTVTGAGTFTIKDAGLAQDFVFTGDLSGYTGNIDSSQAYLSTGTALGNTTAGIIQFGSTNAEVASVAANISGQGTITTTGGLRYNYAAGDEALVVGNSSITAAGIEFQGGASYTLNSNTTVSSALTVASGTSVTLGAGKTLGVSGQISGAEGSSISIAEGGTLNWSHNEHVTLASNVNIAKNASFSDTGLYKYSLTLTGELSGEGTLYSGVPTSENQGDGFREVTISGNAAAFTGTWVLENAYSSNTNGNRRIKGVLDTAEFGGVVEFRNNSESDPTEAKTSSVLALACDASVRGLAGSLGSVESKDSEVRNLTISTRDGDSFAFGGTIASSIETLTISGSGVQALSGNVSALKVSVEEGATLDLSGATVSLSSAITNAGTLNLSGSDINFSGVAALSTTLDEAISGLQSNITETYTVVAGAGTIITDSVPTITVNGKSATFAEGYKTATVSALNVYNITKDETCSDYTTAITGADKINVLGILQLGDLTTAKTDYSSTISGDGTVSFNAQPTNHSAGIKLGGAFTGTLVVSGNANLPRDSELGGTTKLVIANAYLWTGETVTYTQDVEITGTVTNHGDVGTSKQRGGGNITYKGDVVLTADSSFGFEEGTTTFDGSFTGESGSTLYVGASGGTVNFNGSTNIANLEVRGGSVTLGVDNYDGENPNSIVTLSKTAQSLKGNLTIKGGAKVTVATGSDALDYGVSNTVTISKGGELYFDTARWTVGTGNKIVLNGGNITGSGDGNGSLDFYNNDDSATTSTLWTTADSSIEAPIKLRKGFVKFDVSSDATLSVSGNIIGGGALIKTGTGKLTLSGNDNTYTGATTIESGTLVVKLTDGATNIARSSGISIAEDAVLDLGSGTSSVGTSDSLLNLSGTGTVKYSFTSSGEGGAGSGINIADTFKGVVDYAGNLNWGGNSEAEDWSNDVSVSKDATLRFSTRSGQALDEMWGNYAWNVENKVEFASNYGIHLGADLTFSNTVDAGENALTVHGTRTVAFADAVTVGTLNVSEGTAKFAGATVDGGVVNFNGAGGTLQFSKAEGDENEKSYTLGSINTIASDNYARNVTVDEGVSVSITEFRNEWGMGILTVDGNLTVGETLKFATGANNSTETNVITGKGTIAAKTLCIGNVGTYNINGGVRLEIGSGGIVGTDNGNGRATNLGDATLVVAETWSNSISHGLNLVDASSGTKIEVKETASATLAGVLSGDGNLIKDGAGTLTLSNANTYAGRTTISAGTLVAANANALGTNAVEISGGQLEVSGVTLAQTAISIVLDNAYTTVSAICGSGENAALANGTTITVSGDLDSLVTLRRAVSQQYEYQLLGSSLATEGVTVTLSSELESAIKEKGWTYTLADNGSTLTLTIPEPSAFGLLAGVGALALVVSRRKRRFAE